MECPFCNYKFTGKYSLQSHFLQHNRERPYLCPKCPHESISNSILKLHMETHRPREKRRSKCHLCGKVFLAKISYKLHIQYHSGKEEFPCGICEKKFANPFRLKMHEKLHKNRKTFPCNICQREFRTNGVLKRHGEEVHGEKRHPCNICGKMFGRKDSLKGHQITHAPKRDHFKCYKCSKTFLCKPSYKEHIQIHQEKKYSFQCDTCDQRFLTSKKLTDHKRTIHLKKNKIFACLFCEKKYPVFGLLESHMTSHTLERPQLCKRCPAEFAFSTSLRYHNKGVHSKIREQFKCDMCSKTFLKKHNLEDHIRVHMGELHFMCPSPACGKGFISDYHRNYHYLKVHAGKQFTCTLCGKKFLTKVALRKHKATDLNHKVFHCDHCDRSFKRLRNLRAHKCKGFN